jgi:hypothetical protein
MEDKDELVLLEVRTENSIPTYPQSPTEDIKENLRKLKIIKDEP